jgi:hypothetical protein
MGDIFKTRFGKAKNNLEQKIKKITGSGLGLERKLKPKKAVSKNMHKSVGYFHREEEKVMQCLKSGLNISLRRSIKTSVINNPTFTYKSIALADNPPQLEFNCSGHSVFYTDLNFHAV